MSLNEASVTIISWRAQHNERLRWNIKFKMAIFKVPVAAMQRPAAIAQPLPQNGYVESVIHERLKNVRITWNHAATNVAIAGSWDNWETT